MNVLLYEYPNYLCHIPQLCFCFWTSCVKLAPQCKKESRVAIFESKTEMIGLCRDMNAWNTLGNFACFTMMLLFNTRGFYKQWKIKVKRKKENSVILGSCVIYRISKYTTISYCDFGQMQKLYYYVIQNIDNIKDINICKY